MSSIGSDQSSGSTSDSIPESVKQEADNLAADLITIVGKWVPPGAIATELIQELCIYVAERDAKVMVHGYNVGKGAEQ